MAMGAEALFEYGSDSVFPKVLEIKGLPWLLHIRVIGIYKKRVPSSNIYDDRIIAKTTLQEWEILE